MSEINLVLVSDIHLTDRKEDEYRWGIFDALEELVDTFGDPTDSSRNVVSSLFILGDLTDKKDRHQSRFVNRILDGIQRLQNHYEDVTILCGNHDYQFEDSPYFSILDHCKMGRFIREPELSHYWFDSECLNVLLLPHSRNPEWDWKESDAWRKTSNFVEAGHVLHAVFCHQTFKGAKFSTGIEAESGCLPTVFDEFSPCFVMSGDVHITQKVGKVQYVGSPYPINYGDDIPGQALVIKGLTSSYHRLDGEVERALNISLSQTSFSKVFPKKVVLELESPELIARENLSEGDMVKVRLRTNRADHVIWPEMRKYIREYCQESGIYLRGIELVTSDKTRRVSNSRPKRESPLESLKRYSKRENLSKQVVEVGSALLEQDT